MPNYQIKPSEKFFCSRRPPEEKPRPEWILPQYCKHGHPKETLPNGVRYCRTCNNQHCLRYSRKHRCRPKTPTTP